MDKKPIEFDYFYAALNPLATKRGRGFQAWLYASTGIAEPTISNIMAKKRLPNFEQQIKISKALGYEYIDFLALGKGLLRDENPDIIHINTVSAEGGEGEMVPMKEHAQLMKEHIACLKLLAEKEALIAKLSAGSVDRMNGGQA